MSLTFTPYFFSEGQVFALRSHKLYPFPLEPASQYVILSDNLILAPIHAHIP